MAFRILAAYSFIPAAALQATDKTEVKKIQFPNFIKNHSSELSAGCGLVVGFIGNIFLKQVRSKDGTKRIPQQDDIKGNPYQSVENFKKIIFLLCDFLAKDQNLIEFEEIKDSLPKEISGECIIKIGELNESLRNIEENSKKLENELTVTRNFINSNNNSQQKVDNSTVNKIKLENSELNSRLEIQKKENSNLNEKIQELEQQISKQQKEHDDSNKSLRQELENKKKSYEELKLQLDLVKNNSETITKQLNEKNDNLQKELDFLKSENENSDGLENLDQEYSKKMSMLQKEKSRLEEEKNRLEEEKNRLEVENVQIKVLNNDLDGQNKLLQKEKDSFLSKNENFEKEKQNLEQKNEEIENNFKILKEESNKLVSKVSEFKKKVLLNEQQIQKLNDAVSCKDQQITSLNTKIENLKAEIFTKDQQIELQITKQESSSDMTNIKETYEEMFKLKDKLRELERNNSKNQNEIKRIADLFCSVLQEFEFQKTNSNLEYFYNYIGNKINTLNNSIDYPDAESFKKILEMFQKIINFSFYCESNFELKKSQVKYLVNKIVSQSSLNELVLSEDILNNIDNDEVMNKFGEFLQISLSEIENLIKEQKDIIREENFDFAGFKALLLLRSTKQSEMFEGVLKMSQYLKDPLNFANFENEKEKIISYLKEIKSCGVFGEQLAINLESNYEISKSLLQIQSSYPEQTIVRSDIPNYLNEYFKILNCIPVFQKNFGNSFNDSSIIGLLEDYYAILRQFNDSFPEVAYDNIPSFLLQYSEFLNMSNSIAG
ncbi:MAG: hypothetical protein LBJ32_02995, partial [Oscillospiraceae bacterium]|nr:hypothetical protein [Oscillospiraceae bacterium]